MIAMGAGGIKPCVSTNVGDQFGESNKHLLTRVFNWFYFSINAGSALSTLLIPWLLEPYKAAPDGFIAKLSPSIVAFLESPRLHSPDIAFGLPGCSWLSPRSSFGLVVKNLSTFRRSACAHMAAKSFNKETGKILLNILIPVPFVAIFWALWQQNFSSWILQAESMDRHLFGIEWLSSQIQTVNPIFILIMLPLFSYWLYPAVEKVVRLTPLRKIGAGLFVTAASFFLSLP
jgi:POT family proton-dependent oligopeptide transporter